MFRPPRRRGRILKPGPLSSTRMRVMVEIVPSRRQEFVELTPSARGLDLLKALHLAPDAHILFRGDAPIPVDENLVDGDRIRVVGVVSGGAAT